MPPATNQSQWVQVVKFNRIFIFWLDNCQFFRSAGVQLFFENCYWKG